MTTLSKDELLKNIEMLLRKPGISAETDIADILTDCSNMNVDDLCEVTATLRIRESALLLAVSNPFKREQIRDVTKKINDVLNTYGV